MNDEQMTLARAAYAQGRLSIIEALERAIGIAETINAERLREWSRQIPIEAQPDGEEMEAIELRVRGFDDAAAERAVEERYLVGEYVRLEGDAALLNKLAPDTEYVVTSVDGASRRIRSAQGDVEFWAVAQELVGIPEVVHDER